MKHLMLAALLVAAPAAYADTITLSQPMASAAVHTAQVDMNVYWTEVDAGYEVVATYAPHDLTAAPARLVMALAEGDSVKLGLPGHAGSLYSFARAGNAVTVTAEPTEVKLAAN